MKGSVGLTTVPQQQQPESQMPSEVYAIMPWVLFRWVLSFRVELLLIYYFAVCYGVFFLLLGSHVVAMFTNWISTTVFLHGHNHMKCTFGRHKYLLVMVCGPHHECTERLLPPLLKQEGASCYSFSCSPAIPWIYLVIQLWELGRESSNPSAFPIWWGGSSLPGCVPPDNMVNFKSVVGIKPGDSGVVIGYQVNEFTCIWLM